MQEGTAKTKYTDAELVEFKDLILEKITDAREELKELANTLSASNSNGDDAAIAGKTLEDGSVTLKKKTDKPVGCSTKKIHKATRSCIDAYR
jgi:DnaK suppressor protein